MEILTFPLVIHGALLFSMTLFMLALIAGLYDAMT
jgi:hypothetical protein